MYPRTVAPGRREEVRFSNMIRTIIVDDHNSMRRVVRMLLERSGEVKVVAEAEDGAQALRAIEEVKPDVVVLDIYMERLDGFEVLSALKKMPDAPKVVMLSMNDSSAVAQRALENGASAFVPKKMAHAELLDAVKSAARS